MKILVTGGSGFIGSYLVDALLSEGNEIIIFDNMSSGSHTNEKCQIIKGDLLNPTDLEKIPKVDEVWHLAANPEVRVGDPDIHEKQNHIATKNILEINLEINKEPYSNNPVIVVYDLECELTKNI